MSRSAGVRGAGAPRHARFSPDGVEEREPVGEIPTLNTELANVEGKGSCAETVSHGKMAERLGCCIVVRLLDCATAIGGSALMAGFFERSAAP